MPGRRIGNGMLRTRGHREGEGEKRNRPPEVPRAAAPLSPATEVSRNKIKRRVRMRGGGGGDSNFVPGDHAFRMPSVAPPLSTGEFCPVTGPPRPVRVIGRRLPLRSGGPEFGPSAGASGGR